MHDRLAIDRLGAGQPPVVLLHGFTQNAGCWGSFARRLAADHSVRLVDLPGHGGSGAVRADLRTTADLVADQAGPGVIVGYSLGGRVALHTVLRRPEAVTGMVLIGAHPGIDDPDERLMRAAADAARADRLERDGLAPFLREWLAQPLFATLTDDQAALSARLTNEAADVASSLRLTGTGTQEPLSGAVGAVDVPVLVLAGAHDRKFTALGRRLAAAIGDNARFETVAEAGHAAHLERPEAAAEVVLAWLAETA